MKYRVLHVVRRFGPVGGMERYVWRLTSELLELGMEVDILCQSVECDVDPRITIHLLEPSTDRRRWKAMRDFRDKCNQFWLKFKAKDDVIVHSHERCSFHNVTTFHGSPMPRWSDMPWYKKISPRIHAWMQFEREEVCRDRVKAIVPVSSLVSAGLEASYAEALAYLAKPGWPGLDLYEVKENKGAGGRILFVGREWKRKGLDIALEAFSRVQLSDPSVKMDVFGLPCSEIPKSLRRGLKDVTFFDWQSNIPYEHYDVLLHPARFEPFGMIVPEARAAGLSVVTSEQVGALDLDLGSVEVVKIRDESVSWATALEEALKKPKPPTELKWTWSQLAQWYIAKIYSR